MITFCLDSSIGYCN